MLITFLFLVRPGAVDQSFLWEKGSQTNVFYVGPLGKSTLSERANSMAADKLCPGTFPPAS